MLELHSLPKSKGMKKSKRLGRGNASTGNYSGRGMKGQKARSGVSGLKQLGIKSWLMKVPKSRGFKSPRTPKANVNVGDLDRCFSAGEKVTPTSLEQKGLIVDRRTGVKVLGGGVLKKKLQVEVQAVSKTAEESIIKAGGSITLLDVETGVTKTNTQAKNS